MDVYVVDSRLNWTWWSYADDMSGCAFRVDERWPINRIARHIAQEVPADINCLRLCCHGDLTGGGQVDLGAGLNPQNAREFECLRGCFGGNARIEVHACAILSGTPIAVQPTQVHPLIPTWVVNRAVTSPGTFDPNGLGAATMRALSIATQQVVHAPVDAQRPDRNFRIEGPVGTFRPPFGNVMIGHLNLAQP